MTKPLPFTELAIKRAVRAARKLGIKVGSIEIKPDGGIIIHEASNSPAPPKPKDDEWTPR